MTDRSTATVLGTGTLVLTLTLGKTLTLKSVKHVPSISKNLVSGSMLSNVRMRPDFQGGKTILSYKKMYFGNAYRTDGMYKISIIISTSIINEISTSEHSSTLWYRLGHANYRKILNMKKLCLLQNCGDNKPEKCEVCIQTKITRNPFPSVTRSTNLMYLIHSDTSDFKTFVIRGETKYFIDDHSRFCHVYLLKSKDEAFRKFIEFRTRVESNLGIQ